jgi:ADP-heptose:LPS heptosyltransferase
MKIISFSFNKLNFKKWLLVNLKVNKLPDKHIVDRYFDTVDLFDVEKDGKGLDYFIPESDQVNLNTIPSAFQKGYVGFVIGAKHETKRLTEVKAKEIITKLDFPVLLLGGPGDKELGDRLAAPFSEKVYNTCGKYNINQSASLVKQSDLIITHDTGLMHIAAAFKKKILSVWGNTVPEFGMYPYLPHPESTIFENKGLYCRPCSKIGYKKCPKKHFRCINELSVEQIVTTVHQLLST